MRFLRTNLLLKTSNITCEKRCFHSALGGGAAPSPNPPSRFFIFNSKARKYISWGWHDDVVNMMAWMLTMTIVRNLHLCELTFSWKLTALHVRRDACILLWGEFTSLSITLFIFSGKLTGLHVRRDACILLLWGEALRPPPNPPLPLFYSWTQVTLVGVDRLRFLRTNLLLKTSNITCEKRCFHSALGGGAAHM